MRIDEVIQQPGQKERLLKSDIMKSIHVAIPGEVLTFDSDSQTATIQPVLREWNSKDSPPILLDVPVYLPGPSGCGISFPINKGDECLVIFADNCIDAWLQSGGVNNQNSYRMHSMSDGFAFVGFRSKKNKATIPENKYNLFGMFYVDDDGYVCQRVEGDEDW